MEISSFSLKAITRRRPLTPKCSKSNSGFDTATEGSSSSAQLLPSISSSPSLYNNYSSTNNGHSHDNISKEEKMNPSPSKKLKRTLNLCDLIFYGVGCSVGAGIYSLVGIGARLAGPSIAVSFLLCGMACCFTSLSYAEFAARVPLAGSAYVFAYVSFGELVGWLVGWNLTLGYAVSAAVVARSWAEYLVGFLEGSSLFLFFFGTTDNMALYLTKLPLPDYLGGGDCCPLSVVIIALCTVVLVCGVKESTRFNTAMTILNLSILGFVFLAGIGSGTIASDNLQPVFVHGVSGMARGAGLVFFSYLGFDMVSCLAEEVKNPERNMPIGIIGSLLISMTIYVGISIVVVGMAPVTLLGEDTPIINALLANACCTHSEQLQAVAAAADTAAATCVSFHSCSSPMYYPVLYYGSRIVSFGAIFGLTTATFACLMGQPRIFYSMSLDGLLFRVYSKVHPKTGVPTIGTILTGTFTAIIACFIDLESLANAISLGTLQVFTFVNAGVILLRMQPPLQDGEDNNDKNNIPVVISETEGSFFSTQAPPPTHVEYLEQSPLVQNPKAAAVARSLGIVKQTSLSIRNYNSSIRNIKTVYDNGSKPIWLVLLFTTGSVFLSMGITREWNLLFIIGNLVVMALSGIPLFLLPKSLPLDTFTCPCVPFIPLMGIVCNSYMMGSMDASTWNIIFIWLSIGLLFYFLYGIHHSELRLIEKRQQEQQKLQIKQRGNMHHQASELLSTSFSPTNYENSTAERNAYDSMSLIPPPSSYGRK